MLKSLKIKDATEIVEEDQEEEAVMEIETKDVQIDLEVIVNHLALEMISEIEVVVMEDVQIARDLEDPLLIIIQVIRVHLDPDVQTPKVIPVHQDQDVQTPKLM